jgi:hypothetical protein
VADIAAGARRPMVNDWTTAGRISALPRNTIGQQIVNTVLAACAVVTTRRRRRPSRHHYHRRESFVEDAAMSREMFRL